MNIYFGVVENRSDPLELGRCQVRVVGLHTHDKNLLPTSDLPWCAIMQPTVSAAMNGIGYSFIGPVLLVVLLLNQYQLTLTTLGQFFLIPIKLQFHLEL